MKVHRISLLLACSALLASCAYVPPNLSTQRRVSPDYMASGGIGGVRAYVYADRTVLEFDQAEPSLLVIRDQQGEAVNFEKVGRLYRLDRHLDTFTVWLNGASETFAAVVVTQVFAAAPAVVTSAPPAAIQLVTAPALVAQEDINATALLKLAENQLIEVRQALAARSNAPELASDELRALNARMDEIEAQLLTVATAMVRVSFATGSSEFKPGVNVAKVLISSARQAHSINVHGHTDARIAGPDDARIALGRALSARKFLVSNGVDGAKIHIFSTAAGDFIAPNSTNVGRGINRRVEFKFVDSRLAALQDQASALTPN